MFQTDSTRPSWVARSIVPVSKAFHGVVVVNDFLEPLMHIISDLIIHLIQFRVVLYVLSLVLHVFLNKC